MERTITLDNRIRGSLLGFAIGDAMGATTEFMSSSQIRAKYGIVENIIGGGWLNLEAGQVTDDTQMMHCVYYGINKAGGERELALRYICEQFRLWADSNPPDIGGACARAIYGTSTIDPESWMQANVRRQGHRGQNDYGNGGLMRCLVPCLLNDEDLAVQQSTLTHTNSLCDITVSIYFAVLSEALNGIKPVDIRQHQPTGHVVNTERNAEFWFGISDTFEQAILGAVNDGGDADTIAALTGGLAGAYYGLKAIPGRWIRQLNPEIVTELMVVADYILANRK